jgi:hypothetical protein
MVKRIQREVTLSITRHDFADAIIIITYTNIPVIQEPSCISTTTAAVTEGEYTADTAVATA